MFIWKLKRALKKHYNDVPDYWDKIASRLSIYGWRSKKLNWLRYAAMVFGFILLFAAIGCVLAVNVSPDTASSDSHKGFYRIIYEEEGNYSTTSGSTDNSQNKKNDKPEDSYYKDENAKRDLVIDFRNKKVNLIYDHTLKYPNGKTHDVYIDKETLEEYKFDKSTGKFVGYLNSSSIMKEGKILTKDERRSLVYNILKEYIDIDKYEALDEEEMAIGYIKMYDFDYIKKIQNIETADRAYIRIDQHGNLAYMGLNWINAFDNIDIPEIDKELCRKTIENRVRSICQEKGYDFDKHEIKKEVIKLNSDNTISICYSVKIISEQNNIRIPHFYNFEIDPYVIEQ